MSPQAEQRLKVGDLQGFLAQVRLEKQRAIDAIGDVSSGVILTDDSGRRWVFLLPDMTTPGMWRMQRFDARGFSGHGIYNSQEDLVAAAVAEGFTAPAPGMLDELQATHAFQRGNYISDLIRQINSREISHDEADRLLEAFDA